MAKASMYFPADFLWGTASASYQVEGNATNSDWWSWENESGRILQDGKSGLACDWWERAEDDLDRAAEMGTNAHRLSLEWSRIEPEPSLFDRQALDRYREILQAMHNRGIEPMVTLHHFSNPRWLVEKGDFDSGLVVEYFRRFAAQVSGSLGDLVPKWVTFNEPLVYVFRRYIRENFPEPLERGRLAARRALSNMLQCHAAAYRAIKGDSPTALVGVAKHYRPLQPPPGGNWLDAWWARRASRIFNDTWMDAVSSGRLHWPFGKGFSADSSGTIDFVGINYYSRSFVRFPSRLGRLYRPASPSDRPSNETNSYKVYPEGLFMAIKASLRYGKPIFITGNGLADASDEQRPAYLLRHLREVWRALSFSYPIMGYYHSTLVDGFEWHHGWTRRFGLIEMDPETQERRWRKSGELYCDICHSGSISSDLAQRYAPELQDKMFPGRAPGSVDEPI
jgi:beta-glucosidase